MSSLLTALFLACLLSLPIAGSAPPRAGRDRGEPGLGHRRPHLLSPGRQAARPGVDRPPGRQPPRPRRAAPSRQRQRPRRGAQLLLVHQPALPAADDPRGAGRGSRFRRTRRQRALGDRRRQVRGGHCRLHHQGRLEAVLPAQVRLRRQQRNGVGRGSDRDQGAIRRWLQRAAQLRRLLRSRTTADRPESPSSGPNTATSTSGIRARSFGPWYRWGSTARSGKSRCR